MGSLGEVHEPRKPTGIEADRVIWPLGVAIPSQMLLEDLRARRDREAAGGLQRGVIAIANRTPGRFGKAPNRPE